MFRYQSLSTQNAAAQEITASLPQHKLSIIFQSAFSAQQAEAKPPPRHADVSIAYGGRRLPKSKLLKKM